jgi:hypothetical protein
MAQDIFFVEVLNGENASFFDDCDVDSSIHTLNSLFVCLLLDADKPPNANQHYSSMTTTIRRKQQLKT